MDLGSMGSRKRDSTVDCSSTKAVPENRILDSRQGTKQKGVGTKPKQPSIIDRDESQLKAFVNDK